MSEKIERIICGDNLEVLKTIESESVDLIYIDPPFFSGRNYAVVFGDDEELRQFGDRWVKMNENGKYSKDINTFLNWMEPRIREIYRVLKKTGSFYLHCDYHADSYLRVLCDGIFGYNNLINKIAWHYNTGGASKTSYSKKHDTILIYSKGKKYIFHTQREPFREDKSNHFNQIDTDGRKFRIRTINHKDYKYYLDEGRVCHDIWDIDSLNAQAKERLGYPTQKPEALLERIIKTSSNEGDVVMDAFCGCGTTLSVCKKLNRQFIGIDVSPTACRLMADRIHKSHREVEGLPLTSEEIKDLSGWEFQNWINREFGSINGKRGADGGIDGVFEGILIQVKKYSVGRPDLDNFIGVLSRKKKTEGIFIGLSFASTFIKEVNRLKREDNIDIHYFTADDILAKKHKDFIQSVHLRKFQVN